MEKPGADEPMRWAFLLFETVEQSAWIMFVDNMKLQIKPQPIEYVHEAQSNKIIAGIMINRRNEKELHSNRVFLRKSENRTSILYLVGFGVPIR